MKSIAFTFAAILVFFASLSFTASAAEMNQPLAQSQDNSTQIIIGGRVPFPEVVQEIYDEINRQYGTNVSPPGR